MRVAERSVAWKALGGLGLVVVAGAMLLLFIPTGHFLQGRLSPQSQRYEAILAGTALFRVVLSLLGIYLTGLALWGVRLWGAGMEDCSTAEGPFVLSRKDLGILPILSLALVLRISRLDMGFWYDEVMTISEVIRPGGYWILASPPSAHNPLLHSALTWAAFALFGESETVARLFPLLFGMAGVGTLYIITKPLLGWHGAIVGALLMAVSPFHIYYSQEGRGIRDSCSSLWYGTCYSHTRSPGDMARGMAGGRATPLRAFWPS